MTRNQTHSAPNHNAVDEPLCGKIKRKFWKLLFSLPRKFNRKNYFRNSFKGSRNFKSLSFADGLVIGEFRGTSYLLKIRPKNFIETNVFRNKLWEPHIAEIIADYLNDDDVVVVDVGANIGASSIPLAKYFKNAKFFLFEPNPVVFKDLENNINFNKLSNVEAHNIAITDRSEPFLPFYAQKNAENFGLSSFTHNQSIKEFDIIQVGCKSLDSFFESGVHVKVIKIDTQGHELSVLLSAQALIKQHKPVVLFEFESENFSCSKNEEETKEGILQFFAEQRYELYMIGKESRYLPKVTLQDYFCGDILAVPLRN